MAALKSLIIAAIVVGCLCTTMGDDSEYVYPDDWNNPDRDAFLYGTFPDDFIFSSATSAYQIEGGWNALHLAVVLDGSNVKGYTAWSLMDNLERAAGHSERFGLHFVDFNDPGRRRIAKGSVDVLSEIIRNNGFIKSDDGGNNAHIMTSTGLAFTCIMVLLSHVLSI